MTVLENDLAGGWPEQLEIEPGAWLLKAFASQHAVELIGQIERLVVQSAFRKMQTPGGKTMSVRLTNCGDLGWVSDRRGYRYSPTDPDSGCSWPEMPNVFRSLADVATAKVGYEEFPADACLINCYEPGAGVTLHQDKNERDFSQPIVSVSLGVNANFMWGGAQRGDRPRSIILEHGDVMVWGGPARMRFHGVRAIRESRHPLTGNRRYNLTFRKAG